MSDDDFDDDDVFDGLNENDILQSSQAPTHATRNGNGNSNGHKGSGEFADDDVFENEDVEDLLQSSQAQASAEPRTTNRTKKRSSEDHDNGHDSQGKRVKTEHDNDSASPEDPVQDAENVALARRLLKDRFGYSAFRHEQEAAIKRVLAGRSTLVIFPTGAGKSLCYQIPGIAFSELDKAQGNRGPGQSGITIVISPLIALMKDQVDVLKRKGIAADCIDSSKTWEQLCTINQQLAKGELQIIYCSPERLNNERFVESMRFVAGGVRLVAVDEAHCISEVYLPSSTAKYDSVNGERKTDMEIVGPLFSPRVSQRYAARPRNSRLDFADLSHL